MYTVTGTLYKLYYLYTLSIYDFVIIVSLVVESMDVLVSKFAAAVTAEFAAAMTRNNFRIEKELHDLNNKVSLINIEITPSVCCKSSKEQTSNFNRLNEALRVEIRRDFEGMILEGSESSSLPKFDFVWGIKVCRYLVNIWQYILYCFYICTGIFMISKTISWRRQATHLLLHI